ncbi:hypothetical protein P700755_003872 [Psychroflexus torquis ATCC 700755]|uniref:Uncharacterized protein n=1 Tax=Psychroflexus torquis (strain ATCC 700755 / CIP 106069 / ACAM 623) TaxID=313595 RepID=K4IY88_PSYTT|nr:hypothetical protein P700755_003872 [Psychroflexus torquis ATCC 700755]
MSLDYKKLVTNFFTSKYYKDQSELRNLYIQN